MDRNSRLTAFSCRYGTIRGVLDWSLLRGPLPVALVAAAGVAATVLVRPRGTPLHRWTPWVPAALGGAAVLVALLLLLGQAVFREGLPWQVWAYAAGAIVAVALAVAGARNDARRTPGVAAATVVVLATACGINVYYGEFPTPRTAFGLGYPDQTDLAAVPAKAQRLVAAADGALEQVWSPPAGMPAAGQVSEVVIPAPVSGFATRSGWVYLPPAYLSG